MKKIMPLFIAGLMILVGFSLPVIAKSQEGGSIGGKVRTLLGGDPIENASVFIGGVSVADGRIDLAFDSTSTDENGAYVFEDLGAGIYGLFVIKKGYTPSGRVVHLEAGEDKDDVDFNLICLDAQSQEIQQSQEL